MNTKIVLHLLSGGLDSVALLYYLRGQGLFVHCLLFDYGQTHIKELERAKNQCLRLGVKFTVQKIPHMVGLTDANWVVAHRNSVFLSHAVSKAVEIGADTVTIGCNADDAANFPDCRPAFIAAKNAETVASGYPEIEICAPFIDKSKAYIGNLAREMGVSFNEIWSCYRGEEEPCGKCPACEKLKLAML